MTIIDVIKAAVAWQIRPADIVVAEPVAALESPERRLQDLIGDFEQIARDGEFLVTHGNYAGAWDAIRDAGGMTVDYRKRAYASTLEARVDFLIDALDGEDQGEARRLQPLARRHALLSELRALDDLGTVQRAPERQERAESANAVATLPVESITGFDSALRTVQGRRRAAEAEYANFLKRQFDTREASKIPSLPPSPDPHLERWRIQSALAAWDAANPSLAEEIRAFDRGARE